MATNLKRFTISITKKMESELNVANKEHYFNSTKNYMIQDLISRGLGTLKKENKIENINNK